MDGSDSPVFKGVSKFQLHALEGGIWKIRKGVWNYGVGEGAGKGLAFPCLICKGLSFLYLEITLLFAKLYYSFEEKLFFSATIILWKKVILKCVKMNLKIPHKIR